MTWKPHTEEPAQETLSNERGPRVTAYSALGNDGSLHQEGS